MVQPLAQRAVQNTCKGKKKLCSPVFCLLDLKIYISETEQNKVNMSIYSSFLHNCQELEASNPNILCILMSKQL